MTDTSAIVKIYAERPGVYAVPFEQLREVSGVPASEIPTAHLRLSHQGLGVPLWPEDGGDGILGAGDRLLFLAGSSLFEPTEMAETVPMTVLLLHLEEAAVPARPMNQGLDGVGDIVEPTSLSPVRGTRRRVFERDQLRAPLILSDGLAGVETMWFWAMLTQQSSSTLVVDVGRLPDLSIEDADSVEIGVRMLGWSKTTLPEGESQHHAEVLWNGHAVQFERWDGRLLHEIRVAGLPASVLGSATKSAPEGTSGDIEHKLQVKIPERRVEGERDPLLDISYLDRVELRYPARPPLLDPDFPLLLTASASPRWLADVPSGSRAFSTAGWLATQVEIDDAAAGPGAGWVVPASVASEVWIAGEADLRTPLAVEPITRGFRDLPADLDYLLLAPSTLLEGATRLAEFHRRRGLRTAVIDVTAIYDAFGGGLRSPQAIRAFLQHQFERAGALRYVLLVGDADWLQSDDRTPYLQREQPRRNRIPTWTYLSHYGPAASDHFYAMDAQREATPRFAIGRLPVVDAQQLDVLVDKILGHAVAPAPTGPFQVLLLSDQSPPSLKRRQRLLDFLAERDLGLEVRLPPSTEGMARDEVVVAAFGQQPDLVHFGGHGSRHVWQLGDPEHPQASTFFDREDVLRLLPAERFPTVISVSCATAPFDHPAADSLGEVMLLQSDRGTVGYLGASVALSTPRRFSEAFLQALGEEEAVGDVMVRAKQRANAVHVSHIYSLLGDPALPLR